MPTSPYLPNSLEIARAIAAFQQNAVYPGTTTKVYTAVTLGSFKDATDVLPCCEIYANTKNNERWKTGGGIKTHLAFYLLSLADMTDSSTAEELVISISDAVEPPFLGSVRLGSIGNVMLATYKPGSGRFTRIYRDAVEYRVYVFEIMVASEWRIQGGFTA